MACGCNTACSRSCGCGCHKFTSPAVAGAAGARLASIWDRARDMQSRAGLRPYSVCIVRMRSAAARRRGDGVSEIVAEWPILPTPKIIDMGALSQVLNADQLREAGTITLEEISITYSEDVLLGRGADGSPIPPDETVFWEIRFVDGTGKPTQRRRFVPINAPSADMTKAMWTVSLMRQPIDRDRGGHLR